LLCNLAVCIMVSSLKLPTSVKSDKTFGLTVSIPTSAGPLSVRVYFRTVLTMWYI
jgi:hypothetical protein